MPRRVAVTAIVVLCGLLSFSVFLLARANSSMDQLKVAIEEKALALQRNETRLKQVDAQLEQAKVNLAQTAAELAQAESQAKQTEALLAQTDTRLQQTAAQLAQTEGRVKQIEALLAQTDTRLQQTAARLAQVENQLAQTESRVKQTEALLVQTDTRLQQTAAQLAQTESRVKQTEAQLESAKFYFYYVKTKQRYGVSELAAYLSGKSWEKPYQERVFDCTEMSAQLERELENSGFHTKIVVGIIPYGTGKGHAWLQVETSPGQYTAVEATAMSVVYQSNPYFNDYSRYVQVFETVQEALKASYSEFDWWNSY